MDFLSYFVQDYKTLRLGAPWLLAKKHAGTINRQGVLRFSMPGGNFKGRNAGMDYWRISVAQVGRSKSIQCLPHDLLRGVID